MKMVLKRGAAGTGVNRHTLRILALGCCLIIASCVSNAAQFRRIPGVRDNQLVIRLDPPIPAASSLPDYEPVTGPIVQMTSEQLGLPADITPEMLASMQSGGASAPPATAGLPDGTAAAPGAITPPGVIPAPVVDPKMVLPPQSGRPGAFTSFQPGVPASSRLFRASSIDNLRASICLATAIYYEAASESDDGQRAVAQVILNRSRHPAYPKTVCGVVFQGTERGDRLCQFSFACDGSMARTPSRTGWLRARRIAEEALAGYIFAPIGYATHYHTLAVNPSWGPRLVKSAIIGAHIFYRMPSVAGLPQSFARSYGGGEPFPAPKTPIYKQLPPAPASPFAVPPSNYAVNAAPAPVAGPAYTPSTPQGVQGQKSAQAAPAPRTPVANIQPEYRRSGDVLPGGALSQNGVTPDNQINPEYRDSGTWIKR